MRLTIDHLTSYRFTAPQARVVQLLRLTPSDHDGQTVVDWRIDVDCDVRLRAARDGFGNVVHMLYADGPLDAIGIAVRGEVLTEPRSGVVSGAMETLPPLLYRRSTAATQADEALAALARDAAAGADAIERLHALNAAVHACAEGRRPRELTHMFLAAARSLNIAARFVSGHCLDCEAGRPERTAHSWAEAFVDGTGWVGFCPSFGISPDERYVRVATGLDARSAAPVSGTRRGGGEEALDVRVDVVEG